jgi:hypothetical protein
MPAIYLLWKYLYLHTYETAAVVVNADTVTLTDHMLSHFEHYYTMFYSWYFQHEALINQ